MRVLDINSGLFPWAVISDESAAMYCITGRTDCVLLSHVLSYSDRSSSVKMSSDDSRSSVSNRNSCDGVDLPDFLRKRFCTPLIPTSRHTRQTTLRRAFRVRANSWKHSLSDRFVSRAWTGKASVPHRRREVREGRIKTAKSQPLVLRQVHDAENERKCLRYALRLC